MKKSSEFQSSESANKYIKQLERELHMYKQTFNSHNKSVSPDSEKGYSAHKSYAMKQSKVNRVDGPSHDNIYENSLHQQIEKTTNKYTEKCRQYEKLYDKYLALNNELISQQEYAEDIQRERKFLADKLSDIQIHAQGDQMIGQLQNKLVLMSTQIIRLGNLSRSKSQEVTSLNFKIKELNKLLDSKEDDLIERDRLVAQFRQKLRYLEKKLYDIEVNHEYQGQSSYKILSQQLQRLNGLLLIKNQEINSLEYKIQSLQKDEYIGNSRVMGKTMVQLQLQVQKYEKSCSLLKQTTQELETKLKKLRYQKQQLSDQNDKYFKKIKMLQLQLSQYISKANKAQKNNQQHIRIDIQYRETIIQQQKQQMQRMKKQYNQRKQSDKEYLNRQKSRFQIETKQLRQQINRGQHLIQDFQIRINKYEQKLALVAQEIERISLQGHNLSRQYQIAKQMLISKTQQLHQSQQLNNLLQNQANDYKRQVQKMRSQIQQVRMQNIKLNRLSNQNKYLQEYVSDLTQKLDANKNHTIKLQQRIYQLQQNQGFKTKQVQAMLQKERSYFNQKQDQIIDPYKQKIRNLQNTLQTLQKKFITLADEHSSTQNNTLILAEQIQRLNYILSQKSEEILHQKREICTLQNNLQTSNNTVQNIKKMYVHSDKVNCIIDEKVHYYKQKISDKEIQIQRAHRKIQNIENNIANFQKQNMTIKQYSMDLQQKINKKQLEVASLISQLSILQSTHSQLLMLISEIKQSNNRLQQKIENLTKQNLQISQADKAARKSLQNQLITYEQKLRNYQDKYQNIKEDNIKKEGQIMALSDRNQQMKYKIQKYEQEMVKIQSASRFRDSESHQKIRDYQIQLDKLKRSLKYAQNQIISLEQQKQKVQSKNTKLEFEIGEIKNQNIFSKQDIEFQLKRQANKNTDLTNELSNKQFQVRQLKDKLYQVTKVYEQVRQKGDNYISQNDQLKDQLRQLQYEVKSQKQKANYRQQQISQLKQQLNQQKKNNTLYLQQKNKVDLLSGQVTRLNTVLCQNIQELNQLHILTKKYQQQLQQKSRALNQIKKQHRMDLGSKSQQLEGILKQQGQISLKLQLTQRKLAEERAQYSKQLVHKKEQISKLSQQKNNLNREITDLKGQNKRLHQSIQELQVQKYSIEGRSQLRHKQLQQNRNHYEKKISLLISQNQSLSLQLNTTKKQMRQNESEMNYIKLQLQRIRNHEKELNYQKQRQKSRWDSIEKQLKQEIQELLNDRQRNKVHSTYEQKISRLQAIIKDYQAKIALMSQQIQRLNLIISNHNTYHQRDNAEFNTHKLSQYQFKIQKLKQQFQLLNRLAHQYKQQNQFLRDNKHSKCIFIGGVFNNQQAISTPSDSIQRPKSNSQQFLIRQTLNTQIDRLNLLNKSLQAQLNDIRVDKTGQNSLQVRYEQTLCILVLLMTQVQALRNKTNQGIHRPPAHSGTSNSSNRIINTNKSPIKINFP